MSNRHAELFQAVKDEKAEVVDALLSRGEDVNVRGVYGETSIYWAIKHNDIETVKERHQERFEKQRWDDTLDYAVCEKKLREEVITSLTKTDD